MLQETGRIVAIETDALWVETIQQSTCGSCAARKGCGQSLLARLNAKPVYLRVLLKGRDASLFNVNEEVTIGVPEDVVVKSSLLAYLIPLMMLLVFSGLSHHYFAVEWLTIAASLVGLLVGIVVVKCYAHRNRDNPHMQPVLIGSVGQAALKIP